jgi:short-subunit dehydrogenase
MMTIQKAIIIGASSGIGRELAKILSRNGYELGLAARRLPELASLQKELETKAVVKSIDVTQTDEAIRRLEELIGELGDVDLIVISSGYGIYNRKLHWEREKSTIEVNVLGFTAIAGAAYKYFHERGRGHLVGISSIAGIRGSSDMPSYNASKAYITNYLEGLRLKAMKTKKSIVVSDIQPGFVDTPMTKANTGMFWVASVEDATDQIYRAILRKKKIAYVTNRWRLVAWALRLMPDWLYARIM